MAKPFGQADTGLLKYTQLGESALAMDEGLMRSNMVSTALSTFSSQQQQLAQQALTAQRQTEIARAYEPYQRIEFQKGIMTALPTAASTVTQTTGPGVDPLAKAASTGLGAYAAYQLLKPMG